jgi:hypothetical protein
MHDSPTWRVTGQQLAGKLNSIGRKNPASEGKGDQIRMKENHNHDTTAFSAE